MSGKIIKELMERIKKMEDENQKIRELDKEAENLEKHFLDFQAKKKIEAQTYQQQRVRLLEIFKGGAECLELKGILESVNC